MKNICLIVILFLFTSFYNNSISQSASYVGNWESTAPVPQYNGLTVRLQIASTSDPNVFVIVNVDSPKMKYNGKYDDFVGRLYTVIKKKNLYFVYISATDMLECYNASNGVKIADLQRY